MTNYYPYGYSSYPGQPPPQPFAYPIPTPSMPYPAPSPSYPPPANNAFDSHSHPQHQSIDTYEQNQAVIPGLGYGQPPSFAWQQAPLVATQQPWSSRAEPNLIPASQYYQLETPSNSARKALSSSGTAPKPAKRKMKQKQTVKPGTDDAEEGELSEGEFDDLYEPADVVMDTGTPSQPSAPKQATHAATGIDSAALAPPPGGWSSHPRDSGPQSPSAADAGKNSQATGNDATEANHTLGRERSGSYSPHLSPQEMQPPIASRIQHHTSQQTTVFDREPSVPGVTPSGSHILTEARKNARQAILGLWPLGIRYKDYVEEGIDGVFLKELSKDLGLDITAPVQSVTKPPSAQTSATLAKPGNQDQAPSLSVKSAGEERKDRIARLLAAKSAKPSHATNGDSKTPGDLASKSDKEVKQQQKMDALQKSREARAQKAAVRKGSLHAAQSQESSPTSATQGLPLPLSHTHGAEAVQPDAPSTTAQAGPPSAPASTSSIPGLFLSTSHPAPTVNQRKRPVAADFVSNQPKRRPFGFDRQGQPFVIDVSEESDDEDVEMEIGSPTDESSNIQRTDTPSQRMASFRDFPPLSDGRPQFSTTPSNLATPQSGIIVSQPKQAHLDVMNKQIDAMKRQIMLAEARRKLKAVKNAQALGQKAKDQASDATADSDTNKPGMRRVQSMGASSASDQPNGRSTPVAAEASSSMRLPKPSEKRGGGSSNRAEKLRAVSTSLPLIENRLQAKRSKLRLLQSQMNRLQKEIEEEDAEKQKLTEEMDMLNHESDSESGAPQSQLKSNSVDPVVTEPQTQLRPEVQTTAPAAETMVPAAGTANAAAPLPSITDDPEPQPPVAQTDDEAALVVHEVDSPVTGKVATSPPEVPVNQTAAAGAVEDLRPAPSSSDGASDIVMGESDDSSSQIEEAEPPGAREPPETVDAPHADVPKSPSVSPVPADSTVSLANSETDLQQPSLRASPIPEQISLGVNESTPEQGVDATREAPSAARSTDEMPSGDQFTPYESPLQYFHAYRYHSQFAETVAGGLRSLTYSNRIDPKLPICPDQLASRECPRGADCIYQHFESMQLPDDQILLQLGGASLDGPEKARFNEGLRKLLQEMRSKNIKDFPSIAQGIVDYHKSFTGDPSKILPLGNVSI